MKRLDVVNLVLNLVMIVALSIVLYFIVSLNNQVAVISIAMGSANEQMGLLNGEINASNNYAKLNNAAINDLKARMDSLGVFLGNSGSADLVSSAGNEASEAFPYVEIWMDKDHTVNRSSEENGQGNLTWVVVYNGEVVLERNAEGEMSYAYFRTDKGAYVIYMTDFVDGQYRVISNVIAYTIE